MRANSESEVIHFGDDPIHELINRKDDFGGFFPIPAKSVFCGKVDQITQDMEAEVSPAEAVERQIPLIPRDLWNEIPLGSALTTHHTIPPAIWQRDPLGRILSGNVIGWLSPSSVVWKDQRWLAYRTECLPFFECSRVSLCQVNDQMEVFEGTNRLLELPTRFGIWGCKDPRLFVWDAGQ